MIIKIGARGGDPGGMIRYLADTETQSRRNHYNLHVDPRLVCGSLGYVGPLDKETVAQVVGDLRTPALMWHEQTSKNDYLWHAAVVLKPGEGPLSDDLWKNISKDFMQEMGLDKKGPSSYTRWVAVNHGINNSGADHVHIAVNLICEDGHLIHPWRDYQRSQKVAMFLEDKYGLEVLQSRRAGLSARSFSQNDHGFSQETGRSEPRKIELERRVRAAAVGVLDSDQFARNLAADGIGVRFREDMAGNRIGYSVNLPETTTKNGTQHWWAGGKLARDLSLPRLQQVWKNNTNVKFTHAQAVDQLLSLQRALPAADTEKLADAAHQLAGALAVVSAKTEDPPGPIAAASNEAGKLAQTRIYTQRPKPPALSVVTLFLMATDPDGPVGKAVMIKQLMATYRALLDAHAARRYVANPERTAPSMAGAEDEVMEMAVTGGVTVAAVALENHARHKQAKAQRPAAGHKEVSMPWDAKQIRSMRHQASWDQMRARAAERELIPKITHAQYVEITKLAEQFGTPAMAVGVEDFTAKEAEGYIAHLQSNVVNGPTAGEHVVLPETHAQEMGQVDAFMDDLEAKHGHKVPRSGALLPEVVPVPEQAPATAAQVKWLETKGGLTAEEARSMSKGDASKVIGGHADRLSAQNQKAAAVTLTPVPKNNTPAPGVHGPYRSK